MRRLDLIVGPNGAGKTTFATHTLILGRLDALRFVNADVIAEDLWPGIAAGHAYEAAAIAARTRTELIRRGDSFVAETVFSHPSKLDLIRDACQADYTVALHVVLIPERLAVERVRLRVEAGGHGVPEQKIRARYHRLWPQVAAAVHLVQTATVYDNSQLSGPRPVARFASGVPIGAPTWPDWTPEPLLTLGPEP